MTPAAGLVAVALAALLLGGLAGWLAAYLIARRRERPLDPLRNWRPQERLQPADERPLPPQGWTGGTGVAFEAGPDPVAVDVAPTEADAWASMAAERAAPGAPWPAVEQT